MQRGTVPTTPQSIDDCWSQWYYWSHNAHIHYLVFRDQRDRIATVSIRPVLGRYAFIVYGPCWSAYEEKGVSTSLEEAKRECQRRVNRIICEEFCEEELPQRA